MARIKLPKTTTDAVFSFKFQVPLNMINYGNHMGNDSFLTLAHEVRLQFFKSLNLTEMNCFGTSLIQSDAAIEYKKEVLHSDILQIDLYIEDIHKMGFDFFYKVYNQDKVLVSKIKTGMIFYDYENKKVSLTPKEFLNRFNQR